MTWPLGSTPTASSRSFPATTSQSASAPRIGTPSLPVSPAREPPSRHPIRRQYRDTPSHVPHRSRRPGSRRLHAGHHLAGKRAPSRLVPGLSTCPGFDASQPVSTRQRLQRSSSWSPPDPWTGPSPTSLTTTVFS